MTNAGSHYLKSRPAKAVSAAFDETRWVLGTGGVIVVNRADTRHAKDTPKT
jgi:hypothetical protein